jgi:uncharacterized membrane protein YfcA
LTNFIDILADGIGVSNWGFVLLCAISFLGSFITASVGLGGGILTLVTMALLMPPAVLIPVHGAVQLGSNFGRTLLLYKDVIREIIPTFLVGTIIGTIVGGQVVMVLPIETLQIILSGFILYTVWIPPSKAYTVKKLVFISIGAIGAFTSMFVGATGPLFYPFVIAISRGRKQIVATHASLMSIQHCFKLIVFGIIGFSFGPYIPLIISLIIFGFIGTYIGKLNLNWLPEHIFKGALKLVLTVMALKLFYGAIFSKV